ncbi:MAG TPA: hypothetical protein VG672_24705 [Bryobacteraceae bacterium]|jgi:hypothetical protein|nr:hypothetical protein [Bryobacteraceae bacterium]
MDWDRSETIALARPSCTHCHGYGLRSGHRGKERPCNCVFRTIFRACYERFRECAAREAYIGRVNLDFCRGKDRCRTFGRKNEEYIADFCLVSKRHLDELEYKIFRFHFLLGADWKLCCRQMHIDRGTFFHAVYRIEQRLGRAFRELQPYSLFPLDEYFGGRIRKEPVRAFTAVSEIRRPLLPPLAASPILECA